MLSSWKLGQYTCKVALSDLSMSVLSEEDQGLSRALHRLSLDEDISDETGSVCNAGARSE